MSGKIGSSCVASILSVQVYYQVFHQYTRITIKFSTNIPETSSGCCKHKKFQPYGDLVDQVFSQFKETLVNSQDPHVQIENDETPEDIKQIKLLQIQTFFTNIMDDKIPNYINSLNSNQKQVFNIWFIHGLKIV